jgi:hypothetical protein
MRGARSPGGGNQSNQSGRGGGNSSFWSSAFGGSPRGGKAKPNGEAPFALRRAVSIDAVEDQDIVGGAAETDGTQWLLPFESITLMGKIGFGSSGQVFEARLDGHKVAAKQLFCTMIEREVEEFQREARLLARLHHPGLVRFFGVTRRPEQHQSGMGDELFLIMEHCPRSLTQLIAAQDPLLQTPISDKAYREFATQLAQGVAFLHSKNVVHRDLKVGGVCLVCVCVCVCVSVCGGGVACTHF